jgi:hypothetical protein
MVHVEQLNIGLDLIYQRGNKKVEILYEKLGKFSSNLAIIKCGVPQG